MAGGSGETELLAAITYMRVSRAAASASRRRRCITSTKAQYTSEHFQRLLKEQGIKCSMCCAGQVWDNSAMERFFSSMKTGRVARKVYGTREEARSAASTTRLDDTRRRATSVRHRAKRLDKLKLVSTGRAATHPLQRASLGDPTWSVEPIPMDR